MPFDYSRLNGRIAEKCGSQAEFAKQMGLSERSVSLKLNNKRLWKQSEMLKASKILDVSLSELHTYFFATLV